MLPELLRRDWLLHRNTLVTVALIFTAFQVYFVLNADKVVLWIIFTAVYVSFVTVTPITRDDAFRANAWSCTLPVSRADLVRARYATAWLMVAGLFLLALAVAAGVPGSKLSGTLPSGADHLLLALAVVTAVLFLVMPFTIRFGFLGILIALTALQIGGAILFVVGRATGSLSHVEGNIAAIFRPLISGVAAAREALPRPLFLLAALLALGLVNWTGYRLALALFRRREL